MESTSLGEINIDARLKKQVVITELLIAMLHSFDVGFIS
jgi:hypothetical protein